jgi:hypothetical protein
MLIIEGIEFYKIQGETNYFICKNGEVFSKKSNSVLKGVVLKTGYVKVVLSNRKQKYIHRLVAETFIDNPLNLPFVNHIDENTQNNNVNNLEWVTHKQNIQHSCKSSKSYLYKEKEYYEKHPSTRSDFKRICERHNWDIKLFKEIDSKTKRYSNKKYFYIYEK